MKEGYGKIFARLYEGSMVGQPALVFALMGYVIAKQEPESRDPESRMLVDLNPAILGAIFSEGVDAVKEAIGVLCGEDGNSRSPDEGGRRLVQLGPFRYWVVNGRKYRDMIAAEEKREKARKRKEDERRRKAERKSGKKLKVDVAGGPPPGQATYERLRDSGATQDELDRHEEAVLKEQEENRKEAGK